MTRATGRGNSLSPTVAPSPLPSPVLGRKQRVSRRCRRRRKSANQMALWENPPLRAFWQRRYYDFNVFRERKHIERP